MSITPQKKLNVRFQVVQGKNLLIQRNTAYEMDEVGLSIWEMCDGSHSVEKIAEVLTQEYDVAYTQALADCQAYVEDLTNNGLLQ